MVEALLPSSVSHPSARSFPALAEAMVEALLLR